MNKQPTTEQLRKYVAGQLSRAEQYAVERAALDDPFVADALDGLMASENRINDLAELQSRLEKRVNPKENQRLGAWLWASAAAVLLGVGLSWVYFKEGEIPPTSVQYADAMTKTEEDKNTLPDIDIPKQEAAKMLPAVSMTNKKPLPAIRTPKLEEINASIADEVVVPAEENIAEVEIEKSVKKEEKPLPAAAPTMMKTASITKMDSDLSLKDIQPYQITIRGVVKAADGSTLPGVAVNVKGTNRGVNSDINGVFSLDKIKTGDMLSFSFVGFDTKEITVKDSTTQQIILQEDNQVLSEVVVTGYGGKAKRAAKKAARKTKREQKNRR
jgi:hypothetical protein